MYAHFRSGQQHLLSEEHLMKENRVKAGPKHFPPNTYPFARVSCPQPTQGYFSQYRQILWRVVFTRSASVLFKTHVKRPMEPVLYRPVVADYPAERFGRSIFAADVILVGYRGFSMNGSLATVLNDRFYVLPLFLPAQKTNITFIIPQKSKCCCPHDKRMNIRIGIFRGVSYHFDGRITSHNGKKRKTTVIDTQSHAESLLRICKIPRILGIRCQLVFSFSFIRLSCGSVIDALTRAGPLLTVK